ncbi:MAG TPA: isoprenylcysteine carboxylmethyltransferase family protein [Streptosporangiaceae bacterium]|jgi:protein-S-isoprenylcysteine O-methyltransferase Ste14|nr:isoprenylcysteine carboxylmethyltransferase family protein [Streptosporangiaceae bacterium]
MAISALLLFVIGTSLVVGLRTLVQWRRTKDTGHRHDTGTRGSAAWWGKQLMGVANLLVAGGPVAALLGLPPVPGLDHRAINVAGLVITLFAIPLTTMAQFNMGDSWRIGVDRREHTSLVTDGFFGLARNPIFTGFVVIGAGLAMMVPNVVAIAGLAAVVAAVQVTVRLVEEPYLVATHGADYLSYAARAGRFVPGVGRLRHAEPWPDAAGSQAGR